MDSPAYALDWLASRLGVEPLTLYRVIGTVVAILVFGIARRIFAHTLFRTVTDPAVRYNAIRVLDYVLGILSIIIVARIWLTGVAGLLTYVGLVSAGLAIALQEPIANLVGFGFIIWRRPFEVGDRIEIGTHSGDVIDVRLFQFTLLEIGNWIQADQSTGRVIHIPNGWVFRHAVANFNRGLDHIWNELRVTVTFESNWKRAKEVLTSILDRSEYTQEEAMRARIDAASNRYFIKYMNLTPIVWTSVSDDGVVLTMRYLCDPRRRRSTAAELWEEVLTEVAKLPDVDFAYRTRRTFDNKEEGKPGTGGPQESS